MSSQQLVEKEPAPVAIMPASRVKQVQALSLTAKAAAHEIQTCTDEQTKAFVVAHSIQAIRKALTDDIMSDAMQLMNSPLGFKTDRPPGAKGKDGKALQPYHKETVRDVLTQALIRGLRITGNEINIIAGQLYVTKEGCKRLVREFPGLTDLVVQCGVPKMAGEGALVDCKATWNRDGKPGSLNCEGPYAIPIRVNKAMGADAILGKAESKMLRRIYDVLMGSDYSLPDPDEDTQES